MARGRARRPDARHVTRPETGAGDTPRGPPKEARGTLPPRPPGPNPLGARWAASSPPATPTPHARATAVQAKVAVPGWRWRLSRRFESSEVVGFLSFITSRVRMDI